MLNQTKQGQHLLSRGTCPGGHARHRLTSPNKCRVSFPSARNQWAPTRQNYCQNHAAKQRRSEKPCGMEPPAVQNKNAFFTATRLPEDEFRSAAGTGGQLLWLLSLPSLSVACPLPPLVRAKCPWLPAPPPPGQQEPRFLPRAADPRGRASKSFCHSNALSSWLPC